MRALLWKELREQFGRWLPATILMTGVFLLLVRARLVSIRETVILIDVIGGCILSVLLIVETFPTERTRGTLNFLYALPVPPRRIWFAKWFAGALSICAMMVVATMAGFITAAFVEVDLGWFALATLSVCVSMLAFQTAAMPVLMQARHEMDAALGAVSVTGISVAWCSFLFKDDWVLQLFGFASPMAPVANYFWRRKEFFYFPEFGSELHVVSEIINSLIATSLIWIIVPGFIMGLTRRSRRTIQ